MMKVIQLSDEVYERLKNCVVDPFDDTPESVISRLVDIVDKAKSTWSSWDAHAEDTIEESEAENSKVKRGRSWNKQAETAL
jgi:predicted CopG family antitoxin